MKHSLCNMKHSPYKWLSILAIVLAACGSPGDTTPPTISLSASSINVTAVGNITLTADAKDNVAVTKVEFFDGTTKLGEDTTAANGFTQTVALTIAGNGTKSYTAKAFDAAGNNKTSPAVAVTVAIPVPTLLVSIEGLPAGAAANVEVSGPEGFSRTLNQTSTALENLKSGSYSFKVNSVKPDSATFSDNASPTTLNFDASVGGSVTLKYVCSGVKPPDALLDAMFQQATQKANYNCADLAKLPGLANSFSNLANLEGLQYATGLTFLNLGDSKITALPPGIFDKMTGLKNLNLAQNQIAALPPGIFDKLTGLTSLELSNNNIAALPPGIFDKLTGLPSLSLFNNQIAELPAGIFDKLTGLTSLNLSANKIAALPPGIFDKLTGLTSLDLSINKIVALPPGIFDKLTGLTSLNLSSNQIAALPTSIFDKLIGLTSLNLFGNTLTALPGGLTALLPKMTLLHIGFNCLATEQSPLKEMLSKFNPAGQLFKQENPRDGCPQKTITLVRIEAKTLTTENLAANSELVSRAVKIDGALQDFGIEPLKNASKGTIITFNQDFLVLSNLSIDVQIVGDPLSSNPSGSINIGTVLLPVDASYEPGTKTFTLTGGGSEYVVTLELN